MAGFLQRWRKYSKLHALSRKQKHRELGGMTVEKLLDDSRDHDLEELCSIVLKDKDCLAVLSRSNDPVETLRELFYELCIAGAGQWAENLYIPYVALTEPWTLEYLLGRRNQSASIQETAHRVLVFYQDKEPLEWLLRDSSP